MKHQEREELGGGCPDDQSKLRMNVLEMRGGIQEEQVTTTVTFSRVSLKLPPLKKGPSKGKPIALVGLYREAQSQLGRQSD